MSTTKPTPQTVAGAWRAYSELEEHEHAALAAAARALAAAHLRAGDPTRATHWTNIALGHAQDAVLVPHQPTRPQH